MIDTTSNSHINYRLTAKAEFDRVFKRSRRSADKLFTVLYCGNELGYPRLGLAIAKRNVRLAVQRNRLKRLIRESFRAARPGLDSVDIVVLARPLSHTAPNPELLASLSLHWRRLAQRRESSQGNH